VLHTIPFFDPSARLLVCSRHLYSLLYSRNGIFSTRTCDILTRLSAMQHSQPEAAYPEFPSQPQSFHPHSHDFRQHEMSTDHPVDPRSSQPADRSINVSAAQNPYGIPIAMDQRFLANSASTVSQHYPPYLGSAAGPLTGVPHLPYFPMAGFTQGNNLSYIGVLNVESPTRSKQSKKRKRGGTSPSRKCKGEYNISHAEEY